MMNGPVLCFLGKLDRKESDPPPLKWSDLNYVF